MRDIFDRDLKPAFAGNTIDEIIKADVTEALDAIGDRSGSAADKANPSQAHPPTPQRPH